MIVAYSRRKSAACIWCSSTLLFSVLIYCTPNVHHTAAYVRNVHIKLATAKHNIKTYRNKSQRP